MNGKTTQIHAHNEAQLLRTQLQAAAVKLATVQSENKRLRRLTANGRTGRLLHRTAGDARQLCVWRWSGYSVSRTAALSYGMSRRRWHWGVSLLERARVVADGAKYLDDGFLFEEFDDAITAIDKTVKLLEQTGLASLEMRLPRNGYSGRKQSR